MNALGIILTLVVAVSNPAGPAPGEIVALVDGEPIYFAEVAQAANSLALVGETDHAQKPGTPQRVLERLITARLLFVDGRDRRLDASPAFDDDMHAVVDSILAARYIESLYRSEHADDGTGRPRKNPNHLSRAAVREAALRGLRSRVTWTIGEDELDAALDSGRNERLIVARVGAEAIRWRRVRRRLDRSDNVQKRRSALAAALDIILLAEQARSEGLDQTAEFRSLRRGMRRRLLTRLVREEIEEKQGLDRAGVEREYRRNLAAFTHPEQRRIQQIVVETREQAHRVRDTLAAPPPGVSFHTLARDHSIAPGARQTLGNLGWVSRGQGHPALESVAFGLEDGEIGGPVQTSAGFHLIRVLDRRDREVLPLDADTRQRIRARWLDNRVREYARELASRRYRVEVFSETLYDKRQLTSSAAQ